MERVTTVGTDVWNTELDDTERTLDSASAQSHRAGCKYHHHIRRSVTFDEW